MIIEDWCLLPVDTYAPPELGRMKRVSGIIYGHHQYADGSHIRTSSVVKVEGNVVTTQSGHQYTLGAPAPEYVKWCEDRDMHIPTKEEPIKW